MPAPSNSLSDDALEDLPSSAHFWPGWLDIAFVYSAPGSFEALHLKPIFDVTGDNLQLALARHLTPGLPTVFPSIDRYDYRITNAHAAPLANALGHCRTEATDAEIRSAANIERVRVELAGSRLVVLCGNKAHLLGKHLADFPLVRAGHTSMNGLNSRWPDRKQQTVDPHWRAMSGAQRTASRIGLWALDVEHQARALLGAGAIE
jgi:hypothetical protein